MSVGRAIAECLTRPRHFRCTIEIYTLKVVFSSPHQVLIAGIWFSLGTCHPILPGVISYQGWVDQNEPLSEPKVNDG